MDKTWDKAMNFSSFKPMTWLKSPSGVSGNACRGKGDLWVVCCQQLGSPPTDFERILWDIDGVHPWAGCGELYPT